MSESCENCRFSAQRSNPAYDDMRFCRWRPPVVIVGPTTAWPTVAADDWCGEWAPRAALPPTPGNIRAALDAAEASAP